VKAATRELLEACRTILAEYEQPIPIRHLFYRLAGAQVIPNTFRDYKRLDRFLTRWRKKGDLDPAVFLDDTRKPDLAQIWADLPSFLEIVRKSYRRDPWQGQEVRPEVWLEKAALVPIFGPVCREWGVTLQACRGYPSLTCKFAAAQRTKRILYYGDFDPSGEDIPRNIKEELREIWGAEVNLDVIALTPEQIAEYDLPPAMAKTSDSRTAGFVARHGVDTVELDAVPPDALQTMVSEAIEGEITDQDAWDSEVDRGEAESVRLAEITREIED